MPVGVLIWNQRTVLYKNSDFSKFVEDYCASEQLLSTNSLTRMTEDELIVMSLDQQLPEPDKRLTVILHPNTARRKRTEVVAFDIFFSSQKCKAYIVKDLSLIDELEQKTLEDKYTRLTLNSLTHELRTPLHGIAGSLNLLTELSLPDLASSYVHHASCACELMHYLIDDVCDLMFMQTTESLALNQTAFSVSAAVSEMASLVDLSMKQKELQFKYIEDPNVPKEVRTDERRYKQVLLNLLRNADKYTKQGSISVTTSYSANVLTTSVEDTGIGIAKEDMGKLFRLFGKVKDLNQTALQPQGFGIGLTLSKKLCERLGGHIEVESEPGAGSRFTFEVRVEVPSDPMLDQSSRCPLKINVESLPPIATARGLCHCAPILCVDDSEMNLYIVKMFAKKWNVECDVASNGAEAIDLILHRYRQSCCQTYKIVFMDINMPVMDGITASKKLGELVAQKALVSFPLLAFTAVAGTTNPRDYQEVGFTELVNKPLSLRQFEQLIKKYSLI